jgi:AhpD family alkylhydroperoxidase
MARLPYADLDHPEARPLVQRIVAERGSVLHLYQMLLHSPPVARGWLTYLTAIRQECQLDGALRELVIMRVALLNGATYEADQHAPIARQEGVTQPQLDALGTWETASVFSAEQRAVLALTDAMTQDIHFAPEIMAAVRDALGERGAVEATATIAAYNMVSRFLEALQIHADDPR